MDWDKFWKEVEEAWDFLPLWAAVALGLLVLGVYLRLFGIIH